ncbi:MAG: hypothetical protein J5477_05590 [Schwartzia sp.]|nr:hypothetical protein [Schwartzia sp. (in: firmicutes)]
MRRVVSFILFCALFAAATVFAEEAPIPSQEEAGGEGRAPAHEEKIVEVKPPIEIKAHAHKEKVAEENASVEEAAPVTEEKAPENAPSAPEEIIEEKIFEERDGIAYYHGDPNFPVWSMGNRVGAVADLSSAYISDTNEKWRLIGFLSFPVVLREKAGLRAAIPLEEELRECWFWQKVKTGDFFFNRDGIPGNKVEGEAFWRELSAYQMLLEAAEINMARMEQ